MSNELSIFNEFDRAVKNLFAPMNLSAVFPEVPLFNELTMPINVFVDEDGNKVIELSVCGKTKDSITVSYTYGSRGYAQLEIASNDTNKVDSNKAVEKYEVHKLKKCTQNIQLLIEPKYDMEKIYSKVENGLLTITIPSKEVVEQKKTEVEIH